MSIQVEFTPEYEALLLAEAARSGQNPSEYVRELGQQHLRLAALEELKHRRPPQSLEDLKPRISPPTGESRLTAVYGQRPGDESEEEILRVLEELS